MHKSCWFRRCMFPLSMIKKDVRGIVKGPVKDSTGIAFRKLLTETDPKRFWTRIFRQQCENT